MKILIHINSFGRGGAEKSTASFVIKIKNDYPDFEFLCTYYYDYSPGFYEELIKNNISLIQITEKNLFSRVTKFKKIVNDFKPDIVHSVLYESNLVSRLSSIGANYISVESLVNKPYLSEREFQNKTVKYKRVLIKMIDKSTSRFVDHFHSVGQAVADHYLEVYKRQFNYSVVHRGRPIPKINENLSGEKLSTRLTLITTARHEYQKGLIYLLMAIKELNGKVKLQILGRDGAATSNLKDYIRKNEIENDIEFCGYLEDINPVVLKADVYVSSSLFEGLPGSVIEAMALRMPLLLSDIAEHREVAMEYQNAIFFTTRNVDSLIKGIEKYIDKPELKMEFGNKSYDIFKEKFTEKAMVEGMVKFYRSILN